MSSTSAKWTRGYRRLALGGGSGLAVVGGMQLSGVGHLGEAAGWAALGLTLVMSSPLLMTWLRSRQARKGLQARTEASRSMLTAVTLLPQDAVTAGERSHMYGTVVEAWAAGLKSDPSKQPAAEEHAIVEASQPTVDSTNH